MIYFEKTWLSRLEIGQNWSTEKNLFLSVDRIKESLSRFRLFAGSFTLFLQGTMKNIALKWQINHKILLKNFGNKNYR